MMPARAPAAPPRPAVRGAGRAAARFALLALLFGGCAPRRPLDLSGEGVERLVIDLRPPASFAAGHAPGALNLQTGYGQLAARIEAYVPDPTTPLALLGESRAAAERAAAVLEGKGYHDLALAELPPRPEPLAVIDAAELRQLLAGEDAPIVLDVRSAAEQEDGSIPGAVPLDPDGAPAEVLGMDREQHYAIICEGGWRSSQLASWMIRNGFQHVVNVIDGMAGWRRLRR